MSKRRPTVVEAWMTHSATPYISERLVNGRIRKVGRLQIFGESFAQEEARLLDLYGARWVGVKYLVPRGGAQ
jgi:hypothetical protein